MTKNPPQSFIDYQKSLLEKGMAITVVCSHEYYGKIFFNQMVESPSCDLLTTMRNKILEALSDRFQELNQEMQECGSLSDDDYAELLVNDFEDEQSDWQYLNFPNLEWIDNDNPRNGILVKAREDIFYYFELRVKPDRLKEVWENELNIEIDKKIDDNMQDEIETILEELEIDLDYTYDFDWEEMVGLDFMIHRSCPTKTKYKSIKSSYLTNLLAPIFNHYKNHLLYVASPDSVYYSIGRPYFYLIIAGERFDGSHEITIFEALN